MKEELKKRGHVMSKKAKERRYVMKKKIRFSPELKNISTILGVIAVIISVIGGVYGFGYFIDSRVEKAINNEQFIKKVTAYIRPFVIFDANATIYADMGAMQHLEGIEIVPRSSDSGFEIVVTPKTHLSHPPILEQLETPGEPLMGPANMWGPPFPEGGMKLNLELEEVIKELKETRISKRYEIQVLRGQGFKWVFKIKANLRPAELSRWRFRLEILR